MDRITAELRKQQRKQATRVLYRQKKRLAPSVRNLDIPSEFTEEREQRIRLYEQRAERGLPLFD